MTNLAFGRTIINNDVDIQQEIACVEFTFRGKTIQRHPRAPGNVNTVSHQLLSDWNTSLTAANDRTDLVSIS